jgi:hypothetical protein
MFIWMYVRRGGRSREEKSSSVDIASWDLWEINVSESKPQSEMKENCE